MLQRFIGRIRTPKYLQITVATHEPDAQHPHGRYEMHFHAHPEQEGQQPVVFRQQYDGRILQAQTVMDLLSWFRHTAKTFWGNESGGL